MASFTDLHLRYSGVKPYALIKMALEEFTETVVVSVDYATSESVTLTLCHCNEDYVDTFTAKAKAFATLVEGEIEFLPVDYIVVRVEDDKDNGTGPFFEALYNATEEVKE